MGQGMYGKSLHFQLNLVVPLPMKLLKNMAFVVIDLLIPSEY
jgi:hypothetical protein